VGQRRCFERPNAFLAANVSNMTKFAIILVTILFFCSCKTEEPKSLTADSIELTYNNGWTGGVSLRISRNGIENYNIYDIHGKTDSETCYKDTLNNQSIDSINTFLTKIMSERIDSLYGGHCQDCGVYVFLINYPDTVIQSMIVDIYRINNNLTKLAKFLLEKRPNKANRMDSCIDFKTTRYVKIPLPPPPNEYHKFISLEEDNSKKKDN